MVFLLHKPYPSSLFYYVQTISYVQFLSPTGSDVTFRAYGVTCIFVLIGFFGVNYVIHGRDHLTSFRSNEPHHILEEASHLAPHGVPANPLSRNLSNHKLSDVDTREKGEELFIYFMYLVTIMNG